MLRVLTRTLFRTGLQLPRCAACRAREEARASRCALGGVCVCAHVRVCVRVRTYACARWHLCARACAARRAARPRVLLIALVASALELTLQRAFEQVLFEDGRFFHPLDLQSGEWQATHLCGDDVYEGAFAALSEDTWTMTWNVKGPRKDQTLRTRFLRESE